MNEEIRSALLRTVPFLIVICGVIIAIKRKKVKTEDLYIRKPLSFKYFLFWTIGFLVYALAIEFSLNTFNILEVDKWNHSLTASMILIPGIILLAPIAEELLFRGFILNLLINKKLNFHLAILIQAFFFVLLHNFTYQNTLSSNIGIVQSLIDAMLFGYARQYTKSLYTPIAMHITGNAIAIIERFIF
jgi:membrane protease YdiL (CAAX protease family)